MRWFWLGLILFLIGCRGGAATADLPTAFTPTANMPTPTDPPPTIVVPNETPTELPVPDTPTFNRRVAQEPIYVTPLIPFDGIPPVYDPQFTQATEAPLTNDELVMGVAWGGDAKAYPISVLRFREMVNDELAGIPTLVTW